MKLKMRIMDGVTLHDAELGHLVARVHGIDQFNRTAWAEQIMRAVNQAEAAREMIAEAKELCDVVENYRGEVARWATRRLRAALAAVDSPSERDNSLTNRPSEKEK